MLDHLSPREQEDLERAREAGEPWARVLARFFLDGSRLVLGIDSAVPEARIAAEAGITRVAARDALRRAAAWCSDRGLHLLGFPGDDPQEGWRHFMAVG